MNEVPIVNVSTVVVSATLLAFALLLAHNAVLAWLETRAAAEARREVHYHQLVDAAVKAMNTAREEIAAAWERQDRHLESVLESFLSRTFEERQLGRMIGGEIRVDQETDQTLDIDEDDASAVEAWRPADAGKVAAGIEELERQVAAAGLERSAAGVETE